VDVDYQAPVKSEILIYIRAKLAVEMTCKRLKGNFVRSALAVLLFSVIILMLIDYAEAQNATSPRLGEHLSDKLKQKITDIKTNHPELGALADRMQTMNVTEVTDEMAAILEFGQTMVGAVKNLQGNMTSTPDNDQSTTAQEGGPVLATTANQSKIADRDLTGERIASLSNVLGISMVDGIKISGVNIGDTDLSATLTREQTQTGSSSGTANTSSLPVTVIVAKLPVSNLTEIISLVQSSRNLATEIRSGDAMGALGGQLESNAPLGSDAVQLLSLLKNVQIGTGNIVGANWTLPQTISMGLLGLGNREAPFASSDFVIITAVPFVGETALSSVPLR
jgi:hypothetical protein